MLVLITMLYSTAVFASSVTLSWNAPTINEDGTPMTDLAGYKIYYGLNSGNYTSNINAGNVTTYQVNSLTEGATYYFAVTAYDYSGNESIYSNEGSNTVPFLQVADITVTDSVAPGSDQQIPFGEVTESNISQHSVTVTNSGNADLVIDNIALSNPIALPFSILNDYCSGQSISTSSNCTFTVRFSPLSSGSFNDSFDILSNDPDENTIMIAVNGTGLSSVTNNPPSDPVLVHPAHGQRGLGKKVGMKWKKSKDPDGDVVTYDVQICTDEWLTTDCTTGTNMLALSNTNLYYAGVGMYSTGGLFSVMIVTLLCGLKNKRNLALLATSVLLAMILLISCGGGGSGGISGALISSGETESDINYSVDLEAGTTYYWKVVAKDGNGGETSSEVRSFDTL